MKKYLEGFERYLGYAITFDNIDTIFYERLVKYLTYEIPIERRKKVTKRLMVNTIGKTIKQFKSFLKDRMAKKITPLIDFP